MTHKFKTGDKVKVVRARTPSLNVEDGDKGIVTSLGGIATPDLGAVVANDKWIRGANEYNEHGVWFADEDLELLS